MSCKLGCLISGSLTRLQLSQNWIGQFLVPSSGTQLLSGVEFSWGLRSSEIIGWWPHLCALWGSHCGTSRSLAVTECEKRKGVQMEARVLWPSHESEIPSLSCSVHCKQAAGSLSHRDLMLQALHIKFLAGFQVAFPDLVCSPFCTLPSLHFTSFSFTLLLSWHILCSFLTYSVPHDSSR